MLLYFVCFFRQQCLVLTCYVTRQPQAARPLFRVTKRALLWAVSQEGGCVVLDTTRLEGGEVAIGTGHGQGHRQPWPSSCGTKHCSWPQGQRGSRFSLCHCPGSAICYEQIHMVGDVLSFLVCFLSDSGALSSLYSVLLSLPAEWGRRRLVITDSALLFTPPQPQPRSGLQPPSAHGLLCTSCVSVWLSQDKVFLLGQLLLPLPYHSIPL